MTTDYDYQIETDSTEVIPSTPVGQLPSDECPPRPSKRRCIEVSSEEDQDRNTRILPDPVPIVPGPGGPNPAKNWSFTLNNPTEIEISDILTTLRAICEKWAMQEETGENGTEHLQGALTFKTKQRPLGVFKCKRIHWEVTRNVNAAYEYVQKGETRTGRQWKSWVTLEPPELRGWQIVLKERLLPTFQIRNIYWFWEPVGGIGKSTLVRNLCMTKECMMVAGKNADMKQGVVAWQHAKGEGPELIIVDIPRSAGQYLSYSGVEEISNGCFFSPKYESGMCIVRQPIVLCFANERPKMEEMSKDRWQIYRIDTELQECVKCP